MESGPVNSSEDDDRTFAALLREQAPPLPPRAFCAQVLAALPPRPADARFRRRILLCSIGAALGCTFAWQQKAFAISPSSVLGMAQTFAEPQVLVALALTGVSVLFAFWRSSPLRHAP